MQCSLYGKLPTKRDFIAIGSPRNFLDAWEPWLQAGVSSSRASLGQRWQEAFLTAPIWRFWLGANICGHSLVGAFMPSLDGVGRYFPLTLFAIADENATIAPPEIDAQDNWFNPAEELLISALDHDRTFEQVVADLEALPLPNQTQRTILGENMTVAKEAVIATVVSDGKFDDTFSALRKADHATIYAGTTCWWTIGGDGFAPMAFAMKGMPDPFLFASMLTGKLEPVEA